MQRRLFLALSTVLLSQFSVRAERSTLLWGFDLDWSSIKNQEDLERLIALWQPLVAPIVVFPGLENGFQNSYNPDSRCYGLAQLAHLIQFLNSTGTLPMVMINQAQDPAITRQLIEQLLNEGHIPYVLLGGADNNLANQLKVLNSLLPSERIAIGDQWYQASFGVTPAYLPRHIPIQGETSAAEHRALGEALQPLTKSAAWLLGIEPQPKNRALQMYGLTLLLRHPQIKITLAGQFWGKAGLVNPSGQTTDDYEWWRIQQQQNKIACRDAHTTEIIEQDHHEFG